MFELSIAWKYLLPRRRQLSVSIISLVSIVVIALVVCLVILFFSITNGMERHWVSKLIAVTSPIRLTPTPAYYRSYYYQVDSISAEAGYAQRSIGQKLKANISDSYDPAVDEEVPSTWPPADRHADGSLRDLAKEAHQALLSVQNQFPDLRISDYETAFGTIRLRMTRPPSSTGETQTFISQAVLFGSLDPHHEELSQALLPLRPVDVAHLLYLTSVGTPTSQEENPEQPKLLPPHLFRERLHHFFENVTLTELKSSEQGWSLPRKILPSGASFKGVALKKEGRTTQIVLPAQLSQLASLQEGLNTQGTFVPVTLNVTPQGILVEGSLLPEETPLLLAPHTTFQAALVKNSLETARHLKDLLFEATLFLQGVELHGNVRYEGLTVAAFEVPKTFETAPRISPLWIHRTRNGLSLPTDPSYGEGIVLPKTFQEGGLRIGDQGFASYQAPSLNAIQEQRIPLFVAGFYDPGVIPTGGKYVLVNQALTSLIRSAYEQEENALTNGLNVSFSNFREADLVKQAIERELRKRKIEAYWKVETFRQFEFTKDLLQQLRSDKNLSMVIASVIIIVACSNIVSMLIILVNDKKLEIGILRSMGASASSIAFIFGLCGVVMGLIGSLLGTLAALLILQYLAPLVSFLSQLQGFELFNPTFYGSMSGELSYEGLIFVVGSTMLISLLAGVIPAVKASLLKPSVILRS